MNELDFFMSSLTGLCKKSYSWYEIIKNIFRDHHFIYQSLANIIERNTSSHYSNPVSGNFFSAKNT